jgi:hypothetical protein
MAGAIMAASVVPQGCRPHPAAEDVGEFWGSVRGTVFLGPTCPVIQDPPDPECADRPYETELALTSADESRIIKKFRSAADGTFHIEVPPGEYVIRSASVTNTFPVCRSDGTILVSVNGYAEITVYCDTGIR